MRAGIPCAACGRDVFGPPPGGDPVVYDGVMELDDGLYHVTCLHEYDMAGEREIDRDGRNHA